VQSEEKTPEILHPQSLLFLCLDVSTAVHYACHNGNDDALQILILHMTSKCQIDRGSSPDTKN